MVVICIQLVALLHLCISRRLCAEIPDQWREENRPEHTLKPLVRILAVFCLEHSAESEACDMLMEISRIDLLLELVTEDVHERVCLYLIRYAGWGA